MFPDKAIKEFQQIYQNKFGILLEIKEAEIKAKNFIALFALITNQQTNNNE